MAAENLIGNMFGVDPNQLAQQRYDAQRQAALQYAQLDPFQRANMAMYQAGGNLVDAGAGMMGIKAPGQAEAESRQSIMSSIDTSTPDGLLKGAQIALQQGNPRLASELNRAAQVLATEQSKLQYEAAKTAREEAMAEKLARGDNEKLSQAGTSKGVPVYFDSKGQYTFVNGERVPFTGKLDMAPPSGGGANVTLGTDEIEGIAQAVARGDMPAYTGSSARSANGMAIMARVMQINPEYSAATHPSRRQAEWKFTSGPQGNTIRSIGVANSHLDIVDMLADAQKNGDITLFNKARNLFLEQTGSELPTNMDAAARIVGQEVVKGVVGSGAGGVEERRDAAESFSKASSPAQLKGAVATTRALLNGQITGLRQQYKAATNKDDFDQRFGFDKKGSPVYGQQKIVVSNKSELESAIKSGKLKSGDIFYDPSGASHKVK